MIKPFLLMHTAARAELLGFLNGNHGANRDNAALINVLLKEIANNALLFSRLINTDHVSFTGILGDAVPFAEVKRLGENVWRLKIQKAPNKPPLRVIYAYLVKPKKYFVLAVVERKYYNYELTHPITVRIRAVYAQLLSDYS